jgi:peptide/nickel transport system ATP-binding protein
MDAKLLEVTEIRTHFQLDEGTLKAVDGVSFSLDRGRILGLIGESGCGKSVTAQSIMRIVPPPGKIVAGRILYCSNGGAPTDLVQLHAQGSEMRRIRGNDISMVFQEPMTSFSPVHTIGFQIMENILLHRSNNRREARQIAIEYLDKVGIPNPQQRIDEYPHALSGGLRQRAMIAMALCCNPSLLIADEPTTALDVTVQAQILDLLLGLQQQLGMAILYITHDLGVIAEICEQVAVMYLGKVVEFGSAHEIFHNPCHPYTRRLLKSIPKAGKKARVRLDAIDGTVPVPLDLPEVCGFRARCREVDERYCREECPPLIEVRPGHMVRCYLHMQGSGDE